MTQTPPFQSEIEAKAVRAAAGFHTDEVKFDRDSEFEFLFTRAIEFRQETIYFIIVDRFHDGDPSNNEGPNPELYDPTRQKWGKYWGGDLQGIIEKLDYLKDMGVTAIWVSPCLNRWKLYSLKVPLCTVTGPKILSGLTLVS